MAPEEPDQVPAAGRGQGHPPVTGGVAAEGLLGELGDEPGFSWDGRRSQIDGARGRRRRKPGRGRGDTG